MSDAELLSGFVGGARARAVAREPFEERLPGGVRIPGDIDEMVRDGSTFLLSVAREVLIRTPGAPGRGEEDFEIASAQLAEILRAGYTDAARREMGLGSWLRAAFGVPEAHAKTLDTFRDSIVSVLTGEEAAELLRIAEAMPQDVVDSRYTPEDVPGALLAYEDTHPPLRGPKVSPVAGFTPAAAAPPPAPPQAGPPGNLVALTGPRAFELVKRVIEQFYRGSSRPFDWQTWLTRYMEALTVARILPSYPEIPPTRHDGQIVHLVLQEHYRHLRAYNDVVIERRAYWRGPLDPGTLLSEVALTQPLSKYAALHNALANLKGMANERTDITDFTTREMYEIKPRLSADDAVLQLWSYLEQYNHLAELYKVEPRLVRPGTSWMPERRIRQIPLGYSRGRPKVAIPYTIPGLPGLVLYSVFEMPSKDDRRRAQEAAQAEANKRLVLIVVGVAVFVALSIVTAGLAIYIAGTAMGAAAGAAAGAGMTAGAAAVVGTTAGATTAGATVIPLFAGGAAATVASVAKAAAVAWFVLSAGGALTRSVDRGL